MPPAVSWFDIQEKTFTRWINEHLAERGMKCENLKTDLADGLLLINLLEVLSDKQSKRYNKHPRINLQQMENITIALDFIKDEGIQLVNIGSEDIHGGNMRLILGLIWTLILKFEINVDCAGGNTDGSNALLEWIRSKIPEYDIKGFRKDWNDGRAVCALVNALKPGSIPGHREMDPNDKYNNAEKGINDAFKLLGVDPLVHAEEMNHPKVDKMAMMTYLAQFRNIKPEDLKAPDASRCQAYGPGLVEGIAGQEAPFTVETPVDCEGKLEIKVEGPQDDANVTVKDLGDGNYAVSYLPTTPGDYKVSVTVGGDHIPGSVFEVNVLETVSLGGEGKIRVFFSTTSSTEKGRRDVYSLKVLLEAKKIHLLPEFEPWYPVDLMQKKNRDAVFQKAGTRQLPIVFVDDQYIGDYDALAELNEEGKLDTVLAVNKGGLLSEEEHRDRMKKKGFGDDYEEGKEEAAPTPGAATGGAAKFCGNCGAKSTAKFCELCGTKIGS